MRSTRLELALLIVLLGLWAGTARGFGFVLFQLRDSFHFGLGIGCGAFAIGFADRASKGPIHLEWSEPGMEFVWVPFLAGPTVVLPLWIPVLILIGFLIYQCLAFRSNHPAS